MEFAFSARDMAAPVPRVLKLPVFSAVASTLPPAVILPALTAASWPATVTPTAAATCTLDLLSLPGLPRLVPLCSLIWLKASSVPSLPVSSLFVVTF